MQSKSSTRFPGERGGARRLKERCFAPGKRGQNGAEDKIEKEPQRERLSISVKKGRVKSQRTWEEGRGIPGKKRKHLGEKKGGAAFIDLKEGRRCWW